MDTSSIFGGGSALGFFLGGVGGALGSIGRNKAINNSNALIKNQKRWEQNWFDKRRYEDPLAAANAQRILTMVGEATKRSNRAAAATDAVAGTNSLAATQAANTNTVSDTASKFAAATAGRDAELEREYAGRIRELDDLLAKNEEKRASSMDVVSNAMGGAAKGLGSGTSA